MSDNNKLLGEIEASVRRSWAIRDAIRAELKAPGFQPDDTWESTDGHLDLYYETGMEGQWGIIHYDPTKSTPNDNYGKPGHEREPATYNSWDGTRFVQELDYLEIMDRRGRVRLRIPVFMDRLVSAAGGHQFTIYIKGVRQKTLIRWCKRNKQARIWRKKSLSGR